MAQGRKSASGGTAKSAGKTMAKKAKDGKCYCFGKEAPCGSICLEGSTK